MWAMLRPPATVMLFADRVKAVTLARALSLPRSVQRRLAGKPVVVDGNELSLQAQLLLRLQRAVREPAVETLPVEKGRIATRRQATIAGGRHPIGRVEECTVRGGSGDLDARLYVPRAALGSGPGPLTLFFHGGGMVFGDLDSHDAVCRFLAEEAAVRVLSVDYRLAPEHPFPAGVDDAWAALEWVSEHPEEYAADPARLAVAGDSAGGHLAAATAIRAAQEGRALAFQLLIYPMTQLCSRFPSRASFGEGFYLTAEYMDEAEERYLAGGDPTDPRGSVLLADLPDGLAPAYLCTAGFDPLRDEGDAYAEKLAEAGVTVQHQVFGDHIHGFANLLLTEGPAKDHMREVAAALRSGLASSARRVRPPGVPV